MRAALLLWLVGLCACASDAPQNPSLPLDRSAARAALASMERAPVRLTRPVLVLAGYLDPGMFAEELARRLREATGDPRVYTIAFLDCLTFDACRARVLAVAQRLDLGEVDAVGVSMGGLVARHAAAPHVDAPGRLKVARLFTIATPHRGARWAQLPTLHPCQLAMRAGSPFLQRLDAQPRRFPLYCYVVRRDLVVGEANAAPPGQRAWWVAASLGPTHYGAQGDDRIVADIARRLRGEAPFATEPPAPR